MDINKLMRYLAFSLEILVLFMLQQTPGLFPEIYGGRPVLLIPAALSIAMFESELPAMSFGIAAGLFIDFGVGGSLGFHSLLLAVLCFCVSIMFRTVMQVNFGTAILTAVWTTAAIVVLGWVFAYLLEGYAMPDYALLHRYLPKYVYTILMFPVIFLMNRGIAKVIRSSE